MDGRKFRRIPREYRLLCFGAYDRLADVIGQQCEWDSLVGHRGDPWTMDEIADVLCLDVATTQTVVDLLAGAGLIEHDRWRDDRVVQIPALIFYAADWFRRTNAARVREHLLRYHLVDESAPPRGHGDSPRGHGGSRRGHGETPLFPGDPPGEHGDAPGNRGDSPDTDGTDGQTDGRNRRNGHTDVQTKKAGLLPARTRIRYDVERRDFVGVLPADIEVWRKAFPTVNIEAEIPLAAMKVHERGEIPKDCAAYLRNWFKNEVVFRARDGGRRLAPVSAPASSLQGPPKRDVWAGKKAGRRVKA
jgi:hypothetical protein